MNIDNKLSYSQVYDIIAKYDYKLLPYFADGWSRFPDREQASHIIDKLLIHANFYKNNKDYVEKYNEIHSAIQSISSRIML